MERADPQTWTLPFSEKPVLDLEASAASLEVVPVAQGEAPRLERVHPGGFDLPVDIRSEGGVVRVRMGPPDFRWLPFWMQGKGLQLKLYVPAHVRARIRCDAGRLWVERLSGCDLDLVARAGTMQLRDIRGRMVLRADAGHIRGERLGGSFEVEAGASAVRLGVEALDAGEHRVHSSMGSVRVDLSPGLKVRIETRTSMGSTRNRYPSSSDAPAVLRLEADLGSVRVQEAGAAEAGGDWEDWRKHWAQEARRWMWPNPTPPSGARDEELRRILTMVEEKKINAQEAERLIRAIEGR